MNSPDSPPPERLRIMLTQDVDLDGRRCPAGTYGWMVDVRPPYCVVETPLGRVTLHPHALVEVPVAAPEPAELRKLDACFDSDPLAFTETWVDAERGFRILKCKRHGRHFMELMRRQPVRHNRLVFLGELSDPDDAWQRYGSTPDDLLNHLGLAR